MKEAVILILAVWSTFAYHASNFVAAHESEQQRQQEPRVHAGEREILMGVNDGQPPRPAHDTEGEIAVLRYSGSSEYEKLIEVYDHSRLQDFEVLPEMKEFQNGIRVLRFAGNSHQSAAATVGPKPEPRATNASMQPMQPVDWENARPIFRYMVAISLAVPFFEWRAAKRNSFPCIDSDFARREITCRPPPPNDALIPEKPKSLLVIGLGMGSVIKHLRKIAPELETVDAIELDPAILDVAVRFFNFEPGVDANVTIGDATEVLIGNRNGGKLLGKKYDIIIVDCASSSYKDSSHPLFANGAPVTPEISQPLSCMGPQFMTHLATERLSHPTVSVVAINFIGYLEPVGHSVVVPFHRFHRGLETAFGNKPEFVYQPTFLRKWEDSGFVANRAGHTHASSCDNIIVLATRQHSHDPTIKELVEKLERDLEDEEIAKRYDGIAERDLLLDMAMNRYQVPFRTHGNDPLPKWHKSEPTRIHRDPDL